MRRVCEWLLCSLLAGAVVACNSSTYNQTEGNVSDAKEHQVEAKAQLDNLSKAQAPLLIKDGVYVDTTPVSLQHQPDWLKNEIVIRGDQMPLSYYTRIISAAADKNVLMKYQAGMNSAMPLSISYTGTVKGALELLAAKTGYVFNIRGSDTVYWQAYITRTFSIAFMPGTSDYVMGQTAGMGSSSGGSGSSSGSPTDTAGQEYSALSGKSLSVWADVEATVKQLLSTEGKASVSQAATSVTVRDRPTNVELVGQYVRNLNKSLSQQVFVKIEILDVLGKRL
jgi:hypothetical protein